MDEVEVDMSSEGTVWYPNTIPNRDAIYGMIILQAAQGTTSVKGGINSNSSTSFHHEATPMNAASTSDIPASGAGVLETPSLTNPVHRGDVVSLSYSHCCRLRWLPTDLVIDQRLADGPDI